VEKKSVVSTGKKEPFSILSNIRLVLTLRREESPLFLVGREENQGGTDPKGKKREWLPSVTWIKKVGETRSLLLFILSVGGRGSGRVLP